MDLVPRLKTYKTPSPEGLSTTTDTSHPTLHSNSPGGNTPGPSSVSAMNPVGSTEIKTTPALIGIGSTVVSAPDAMGMVIGIGIKAIVINPDDYYLARVGWWPDGSVMAQVTKISLSFLFFINSEFS